ncbi:hypothetical protein EAF56_07650 [Vibrio alginolyticus]|uniref:Uncharacterized protein n=1 Tax=Vibrio alginolyticus TaxID=663 RepID=A0AA36UPZ9_VIBAL|nr:hypothetical protein [Vibrio alginolyticus]EGR1295878.1 hypothetical protein [Vibrio alginolyticus]
MMTINEQENLTLSDRKCCTESVRIFASNKNKMGSSWLPKTNSKNISGKQFESVLLVSIYRYHACGTRIEH